MARHLGPTLLTIPYELRSQIYTHITTFIPPYNPYDVNPPLHPLLLTNRQLYNEFAPFHYGTNIFHLRIRRSFFSPSTHKSSVFSTAHTLSFPINGYPAVESEQEKGCYTRLPQWHFLSRPVLYAFREIMLHIDDTFLQTLFFGSNSTCLASLIAMISLAPNIEVLHIHHSFPAISRPYFSLSSSSTTHIISLPTTSIPLPAEPPRISMNLIPLLTQLCASPILPNLLLLVVHIDKHTTSDRGVGILLEKVAGIKFLEWTRGYSWSLVECDMGEGQQKWGQNCEHAFRVTDRRRLGGVSARMHGPRDDAGRKAKEGKENKEKFRRLSVDRGINPPSRVVEVVQGVKELELEAMDTRLETVPCSDQGMTQPMLVHG